jgi:hypothetical protein
MQRLMKYVPKYVQRQTTKPDLHGGPSEWCMVQFDRPKGAKALKWVDLDFSELENNIK